MSSETGVVEIEPENVLSHGRLEPGKIFLVDMDEGKIVNNDEIKSQIVSKQPYRKWVNNNILQLKDVPYTGNRTPDEANMPLLKHPKKPNRIHYFQHVLVLS